MSPKSQSGGGARAGGAARRERPSSKRRRRQGAAGAGGGGGESPRTGAKRTLMGTIRQLPSYIRLLFGLLADARVSMVDKALVAGAVLYIISPFDFITDAIPFIGQVDDVFLLVTALQRLITNAGRRVVIEHWSGPVEDLADLNLERVLTAASFFLPGRIRRRLKMIGR